MDLITLDEYKSYKKMSANPENDGVLSAIISSVSSLIKTYCGRKFIEHYDTPITEVFSVKPGVNKLILQEIPIRLVSAVDSSGLSILGDTTIDTQLGMVVKNEDYFTSGTDVVSVTYTGGYEETPYDIKLAAFELVDYYYQSEHKAKRTFGGATVEYQPTVNEWPFHIQSILDMYRDL